MPDSTRSPWTTPAVRTLSVSMDTASFSGSQSDGAESTSKTPA